MHCSPIHDVINHFKYCYLSTCSRVLQRAVRISLEIISRISFSFFLINQLSINKSNIIYVIIFRARNLSICLSFSRFALFLLFFIIMGREDYIKYLRLFVMQIIYILSLTLLPPPPVKLRIIQGHIINHCQYNKFNVCKKKQTERPHCLPN